MALTSLDIIPQKKSRPKNISILGATGSIGDSTISLIEENPEQYNIQALTARKNVEKLIEISLKLLPKLAVIQDEKLYAELKEGLAGTGIEVTAGKEAINQAATLPCDLMMIGIVGIAALEPTFAAIKQGNSVALANKECLVCAGDIITSEAEKRNVTIIPVDSEHNSIFQTCDFNNPGNIEKILLTASGGPFYNTPREKLKDVTPKQAVAHPNWSMGAKISVDSATLMNKGLEIIEAYHLFPIEKDKIDTIIHPQSIIHSLVYYKDGSVIAGMSTPDMKVPIAYALSWPDRIETNTPKLNLAEVGSLTFHEPDEKKFPALRIAKEVLKAGGSAPVVLNASNEIAVEFFLGGKIGFLDIVKLVENALERVPESQPKTIDEILAIDKETRSICRDILQRI